MPYATGWVQYKAFASHDTAVQQDFSKASLALANAHSCYNIPLTRFQRRLRRHASYAHAHAVIHNDDGDENDCALRECTHLLISVLPILFEIYDNSTDQSHLVNKSFTVYLVHEYQRSRSPAKMSRGGY